MKYVIRRLEAADVSQVYALCIALFDESAQKNQGIDRSKGLRHLYDHVDNPYDLREIFVAVDRESDRIIGFLKCFISEYWYSNDRRAVHEFLYVTPEHRATKVAVLLVESFVEWAKERDAITCMLNAFIPSEQARDTFIGLASRCGFEHAGVYFKKDIGDVRR